MQKEDNPSERYALITFLVEQMHIRVGPKKFFDSDPSSILHWAMCKCGLRRKSASLTSNQLQVERCPWQLNKVIALMMIGICEL